MLKIYLVLLLIVASTFAIECPEYDLFYGVDYFDNVGGVVSWQDCGEICALTAKCSFWTWVNSLQCHLYDTNEDVGFQSGPISGEKGCP